MTTGERILLHAEGCPVLLPEDTRPLPAICVIGEDEEGLRAIAAAMRCSAALAAIPVDDWNAELSPWSAPGLRRGEEFGGGAERTLERLDMLMPAFERRVFEHTGLERSARIVMGYSLAGLCALWAAVRRDGFDGVGSISGSLWYDGLGEYLAAHPVRARSVYLSLGDAEPRARNQRLAQVGAGTQAVYEMLVDAGINARFDWNRGNHFVDVPLRMARGADWLCENVNAPPQAARA